MKIYTKPRDFSYINHKDNYPLQLKGNMLGKRPHSALPKQTIETNILKKQIIDNYQQLKSVVPKDLSNKKRSQSIKTYNKDKYIQFSGAAYLMIKSSVQKDHYEKKHLTQKDLMSIHVEDIGIKGKKHFNQNNAQIENEKEKQVHKVMTSTLRQKLDHDLYSNLQTKENISNITFKSSGKKNMFMQSVDLGYEKQREPKMSTAKKAEMLGQSGKKIQENHKIFRDDWRRSSITFG